MAPKAEPAPPVPWANADEINLVPLRGNFRKPNHEHHGARSNSPAQAPGRANHDPQPISNTEFIDGISQNRTLQRLNILARSNYLIVRCVPAATSFDSTLWRQILTPQSQAEPNLKFALSVA